MVKTFCATSIVTVNPCSNILENCLAHMYTFMGLGTSKLNYFFFENSGLLVTLHLFFLQQRFYERSNC